MEIINLVKELLVSSNRSYKRRNLDAISVLVIHHSGTTAGAPKSFAEYHVMSKPKGRGWPGIGYHYVIGKRGQVWQTNDDATISYQAASYNGISLGICLVGNFDIETPSKEQLDILVLLCKHLISTYLDIKRVIGHRETGTTKKNCPGLNFDMNALRERLGVRK